MNKNKQIKTGKSGDNIEFINTRESREGAEALNKSLASLQELYNAEKKLTRSLVDSYRIVETVTKKEFYGKLLKKLKKIQGGEMTLDEYIAEVKEKVKKYA